MGRFGSFFVWASFLKKREMREEKEEAAFFVFLRRVQDFKEVNMEDILLVVYT